MYEQDLNMLSTKKEFVIQKPILFKSNSCSNFIYKVKGNNVFEFLKIENENFQINLFLEDSQLPEILAQILLKFYLTKKSKLSELTELISLENFLHYDYRYRQNFYEHKIKRFLVAAACGLTVDKVWKGNYDKHIYVFKNKNGVLEFIPLYELNKLEDHLFFTTRLENPKYRKLKLGKIYEEKGEFFIKLNLQIIFC